MPDMNKQMEALEAENARLREALYRPGAAAQQAVPPALSPGLLQQPYLESPAAAFLWLGKLALTLVVAAFIAGFFLFVHRAPDPMIHVYGEILALLLLVWGLYTAAPERLVSQGVLACGLGAGFLAALDRLGASPSPTASLGMLCFIAGAVAAVRWKQSETAFSAVAALACVCAIPDAGLAGAGGTAMSVVLGLCVLLIAGPRSGTFPIWTACAAVFAQLALPMMLTVTTASPARQLTALLLIQSLMTLACLRYVLRGGPRLYNAALMVFVNSLLCLVVLSSVLDNAKGGTYALAMALAALLFALLAAIAYRWRPAANLLMACLATMATVAAAMGVWSGLPEELFAPALAAGAALLVLVYRQTASPLLRRLEVVSAIAAFGFCLFRLQLGGLATLGPLTLPANWLNALGTMFFLCFAATLHDKCFPGGPCREPHHTQSMAHAALAALILLTITVLSRGADTALPFVLAAESLGMVGLGLVLFTPQIGVAAMFLLAPAHLCWHAFLWQPLPGFSTQPEFTANTAGLIAFTLAGAIVWEHYLRRFHRSTTEWDHYAVAALPFLAAAFLSWVVLRDELPDALLPAGMATLGVLCLAPSRLLHLDGLILAAVFCLGTAAAAFGLQVQPALAGTHLDGLFVPGATGMILMFVMAERLAAALYPGTAAAPNRPADAVRLLLRVLAVAATAVGLYAAAAGATLAWGLTGASVLFVFLAWTSAMPLYGWCGVLMLLAVPVLSFARLQGMAPGRESVAALGLACALTVARLCFGLGRENGNQDDDDA